ncbi:MAG: hypothetical protein DI535_16935 [Citrobacter freundii]|nr:MAG: hypothetical protein DI535_16935 [Citrobacter freundii]
MSKGEDSILIIDPVGIKAGMDYYDQSLAGGLRDAGLNAFVGSNYKKDEWSYKIFDSEKKTSKIGKLTDLVKGVLRAIILAKRKKTKYVLLHIFSTEMKDWLTIILLRMANLKVVSIAHDISGFADTDVKWIKDSIFDKHSAIIIVHNRYSLEKFKQTVKTAADKIIRVIPHGSFVNLVDKNISKKDARDVLKIAPDSKVILFFGQIKKVKGLDILLHAMPDVEKSITLVIAGKPWKDDFKTYGDIIKAHGLQSRVKLFIRYIEDSEREFFFKAADLLIIPYRAIFQSGVLLMGMSYQLPVLASDLEANREVITDNENGMLFRDGNSKDLAQKINLFFENESQRERITKAGIQTMGQKHNWSAIALEYKKILHENSNNRV